MICPLMSRPLAVQIGRNVKIQLAEVECVRERCIFWAVTAEVPHCTKV